MASAGLLAALPGRGLAANGGTIQVVVRAEAVDVPLLAADGVVDELKAEARAAQEPIVEYVEDTAGLSVRNQFWLANALLLEADPGVVDLEELAAQEGVRELHENFAMEIPEPELAASDGTTYGLDQIDAPAVWEEFESRGEGAKIAVLDTGVDPDHPDIDIDPADFAEFDSDGEEVDSDPHDTHYHGTHVSGTVVGGDESGTAIGVAPEATLMHGLVLPDGGGEFAQIVGGMEWAVENDADAINMSLGVGGYHAEMVEPVGNAERAGTIVISSSGNDGPGTSGSPANVYEAFAIGATDEDEAVAGFSSGETVDTESAWGHLAPEEWPDSYVVPDVSAPGVDVLSAFPVDHASGPYEALSGTSMASPHVAGVVGLIESAAIEEATIARTKAALASSARKPEDEPAEQDTRYGHGIVDAFASVGRFAAEGGVTGAVADSEDEPIVGATVELDGFPVETDADGAYLLRAVPGEYEVTADAFGYASETVAVEVGEEFTTVDFTLSDSLAVALLADQPEGLEAGESFDVAFDAAHAESVAVELGGEYAGGAELFVDGEEAAFGEPVTFESRRTGEVTITVDTDEDGQGDLELEHTFEGLGDSLTITTGPTSVFEQPVPIGVVDAGSGFAGGVEAILSETMHPRYYVQHLDPGEALAAAEDREHEGYVVQDLGDDEELIADFVDVATAPDVGVVYLDQYGDASDAVSQISDATGDPQATFDALVEMTFPAIQPVRYQVNQDHAVFDGIAEEGEDVTITEPDPVVLGAFLALGGFHTYFEDYSGGIAGATLADTSVSFTETGSGLAIDDLSRTVLASSLGLGSLVDGEHFTDAGRQLLGALVSHAANTPPLDPVQVPAERIAPGGSATAEIAATDVVEVEVDVAGLRFLDAEDMTLYVDGEERALGEPITYEEPFDGTVEMTIRAPDAVGEFAFDVRFVTLDEHGREVETPVTFRPTMVYESPLRVPEHLEDLQAAVDFVLPGDAVEVADGTYEVDEPDRGFQTGLYVGTQGITVRAADGADPEIVHARDLPSPRIVTVDADDVTVDGLDANVVDGAVDEKNSIGSGIIVEEFTSGVTVRNCTVAGTFGVQFEGNISDVTVENVRAIETVIGVGTDSGAFGDVEDATITGVTVTDRPEFTFRGGVIVDSGAVRTTVTDCDIELREGENGIVLEGPFGGGEDCRVANNTVVGVGIEEADLGFTITEAAVLVDRMEGVVEDNEIEGVGIGVQVGDRLGFGDEAVVVRHNDIQSEEFGYRQTGDYATVEYNDVDAEVGIQLGEDPDEFFPTLIEADQVLARYNDLSDTDVPFVGEPDEAWFDPVEGPFDCRENYLGDRDYEDAIAIGDVAYDPYLTVPPEELGSMDGEDADAELIAATDGAGGPTEIATDLFLDPGESYGLGVPGPSDQTIYGMLGVDGYREFAGEIEFWHHDRGEWQRVTGEGDLAYADTLYAFRVTPEEGVRAELQFQRADDPPVGPDGTPPGHRDAELDKTHLREGWNFVAAPIYGDEGDVFDVEAIEEVVPELHSPGRQLGTAEKNAFTGYKVRASEESWLKAGVDAYDPTMVELYEGLGLDPTIHEEAGAGVQGTSEVDVTVEDLLEAAPDDDAAREAVAELVGHRIAAEVDLDADDPGPRFDQIETVVDAAGEEAPAGADELVEAAIRDAVRATVATRFGAEIRDEDGLPIAREDEDVSRVQAEVDD